MLNCTTVLKNSLRASLAAQLKKYVGVGRYMLVDEAADRLNCSGQTLRNLMKGEGGACAHDLLGEMIHLFGVDFLNGYLAPLGYVARPVCIDSHSDQEMHCASAQLTAHSAKALTDRKTPGRIDHKERPKVMPHAIAAHRTLETFIYANRRGD